MRNLIITNKKNRALSLFSLKIYIEDHALPDTSINGIPCRKLGVVKNGETATFKIANKPAIVFAVTCKGLRNLYSDCYEIYSEDDDVHLCGTRKFNPFNASSFKFENGGSEEVDELRKKTKKKLMMGSFIALSVIMLLSTLSSMNLFNSSVSNDRTTVGWVDEAPGKEFSSHGISIWLNENFSECDSNQYNAIYDSERMTVFITEETFAKYPDFKDLSIEEYLKLVISSNKLENIEIVDENGLIYFVAETINSNTGGEDVHYLFGFKTENACWLIQFGVGKEHLDELKDDIFTWAKSIEFE